MIKADHHVVIIGGGFGGMYAAKSLRRARGVRITLIDRRNFHLFQPLLYQVAMGALSPANIASPLRGIFRRQRNVEVVLGEVRDIDPVARRVFLAEGEVDYDSLIVAGGVRTGYFGQDQWASFAPGLKSIEDATEIRRRVLTAFEAAEREADPKRQQTLLTFVVVGAGPTGVELAGALADISRDTLAREFRRIRADRARVILLDGVDRVLPAYPQPLSAKARRSLERLGVEVRTGCRVKQINEAGVRIHCDTKGEDRIAARTVLWGAGIRGTRLGGILGKRTGAALDPAGRVRVGPDCSVEGHPDLYVIGDLAWYEQADGKVLPGVAPVAMQQGRYVARLIQASLQGRSLPTFAYRDYGSMATIGRAAAVADLGWVRFSGLPAWLTWLFVHLMYITEFQNRILVLLQWAWNYFTYNRSARLITGVEGGVEPAPARERPGLSSVDSVDGEAGEIRRTEILAASAPAGGENGIPD